LQKNNVLKTKFRKLFGKEKSNGQWLEKDCERGLFGRIYYIYLNMCQSHAFIDSSCLVKETIGRVMTFEKTMLRVITIGRVMTFEKTMLRFITLNFFFKTIHW